MGVLVRGALLAEIVAAAGLLTGAVSAVFGPVMAASPSSRRTACGQSLEPPPQASVWVRPLP
jgi:hypothetical protein